MCLAQSQQFLAFLAKKTKNTHPLLCILYIKYCFRPSFLSFDAQPYAYTEKYDKKNARNQHHIKHLGL